MAASASISREQLMVILERAGRALRETKARPDDTDATARALATACATEDVDPAAFDDAIANDPELELLKANVLRDAHGGTVDPGPYAEISREAATGRPGDTTVGPGAPDINRVKRATGSTPESRRGAP